jgi:hypothetical protein
MKKTLVSVLTIAVLAFSPTAFAVAASSSSPGSPPTIESFAAAKKASFVDIAKSYDFASPHMIQATAKDGMKFFGVQEASAVKDTAIDTNSSPINGYMHKLQVASDAKQLGITKMIQSGPNWRDALAQQNFGVGSGGEPLSLGQGQKVKGTTAVLRV